MRVRGSTRSAAPTKHAGEQRPEHAHVEDVRPERGDAAVGEHERLRREHDAITRQASHGPSSTAASVAPRRCPLVPPATGKFEHLDGEDEGGEHAEQRDALLVEHTSGDHQRVADGRDREHRRGGGDVIREEAVRDVQREREAAHDQSFPWVGDGWPAQSGQTPTIGKWASAGANPQAARTASPMAASAWSSSTTWRPQRSQAA